MLQINAASRPAQRFRNAAIPNQDCWIGLERQKKIAPGSGVCNFSCVHHIRTSAGIHDERGGKRPRTGRLDLAAGADDPAPWEIALKLSRIQGECSICRSSIYAPCRICVVDGTIQQHKKLGRVDADKDYPHTPTHIFA
jgi:hypothetical protein